MFLKFEIPQNCLNDVKSGEGHTSLFHNAVLMVKAMRRHKMIYFSVLMSMFWLL